MLGNARGKKLEKYIPDYVVFDLETTGVSVVYDKVVEISAVRVRGGKAVDEFSALVNPGRKIPYGASQVNGITDDMVADAPAFDEVLPLFLDFAGEDVLVGHNIHTFDMKFIYRDAEKFFGKLPGNDYIDTLFLARRCLPGLSHHRLVDLAVHYGISSQGAHRALRDCHINHAVFGCLAKEMEKAGTSGEARTCPLCGQTLVKRRGKYGEFWGCTGFPMCRYTERVKKGQ